ncbi:hypothetical protein SNK03_004488 [Fusarium graminearum]|uniref:Chromosome 2, complete genome n=2 Tax=Gibberella zeae TaxID=5518 RepID=A0A0E0RZ59_GIBZE|nr:hypothetical protein FG05_30414 [Fusarium graminearum]KAI6753497.1 hypothetical protein HG531_005666 [Fusarium graminearum]CAF3447867.1 unnamed protein product [Fusarium graminearum]CAF3488137.1 unnamed protein product [Fusarium graminearum]CAF3491042.1 unnamed protein product [Fusarium graminearum]
MGNPLSNNTSTPSQSLPKLTFEALSKIQDGPGMMMNAMKEQNHEKVALGIHIVRKEIRTYGAEWQKRFDEIK